MARALAPWNKLVRNEQIRFKRISKVPFLVQMLGFAEFIQTQITDLAMIFSVTETTETAISQATSGKTPTLIKMDTATVDWILLPTTGGLEITGTDLTLDVSSAAVSTLWKFPEQPLEQEPWIFEELLTDAIIVHKLPLMFMNAEMQMKTIMVDAWAPECFTDLTALVHWLLMADRLPILASLQTKCAGKS